MNRCPTCESTEPAVRYRRYSTRRPNRMRLQSGWQVRLRPYRGSPYWILANRRGGNVPPSLRAGRQWKLVGENRGHRNMRIYECNDRWHVRNEHDLGQPFAISHPYGYDPDLPRGACADPRHRPPRRSVNTKTPEERRERARERKLRHKRRNSAQRR